MNEMRELKLLDEQIDRVLKSVYLLARELSRAKYKGEKDAKLERIHRELCNGRDISKKMTILADKVLEKTLIP